jgi:Tat protein translocase TatB subunit
MFGLSWSELVVVAVVGILLIDPKDLPGIIRKFKEIVAQIKQIGHELTSSIKEIDEIKDLKAEVKKLNEDIKTIIDLEGNVQRTYDISDVMPEIEKAKKENSDK